eukprot:7073216-Alexandrium_andersonii.AAC.1
MLILHRATRSALRPPATDPPRAGQRRGRHGREPGWRLSRSTEPGPAGHQAGQMPGLMDG